MKYRVILTATAERGLREAIRWLSHQTSPGVIARWYDGLIRKVETLQTHPARCPLAVENEKFPQEIRELLYGRQGRGKYRILFTIADDTVQILYIRHAARDELEP